MKTPNADSLELQRSNVPKRGVAAFDFDGTLASKHTLLPFLIRTHGLRRVILTMLRSLARERNRDKLKVIVVGTLFKGMAEANLAELGESYSATLPEVLRPQMLERLRWHQGQGHATVIISASLGIYLRPLAARLGIDGVLGVELSTDNNGILDGGVCGGVNNRGQEKVVRLQAWVSEQFGDDANIELWAYGDDSGDRELLEVADHPLWIGP